MPPSNSNVETLNINATIFEGKAFKEVKLNQAFKLTVPSSNSYPCRKRKEDMRSSLSSNHKQKKGDVGQRSAGKEASLKTSASSTLMMMDWKPLKPQENTFLPLNHSLWYSVMHPEKINTSAKYVLNVQRELGQISSNFSKMHQQF